MRARSSAGFVSWIRNLSSNSQKYLMMHIRSFYVCVSDVWIATCVFFLRFRPVPTLALCVCIWPGTCLKCHILSVHSKHCLHEYLHIRFMCSNKIYSIFAAISLAFKLLDLANCTLTFCQCVHASWKIFARKFRWSCSSKAACVDFLHSLIASNIKMQ